MPEIIPNWHPLAVHFPIALVITATLLLLGGRLRPATPLLAASARLLLQIAAPAALLAAALGWQAYLTVAHDSAGHLVMTRHRDWALLCTASLLVLTLWDALRQRAGLAVHVALLPALLVLSGGFGMTGWLGGEMVYRHQVGVLPLSVPAPAAAIAPALTTPADMEAERPAPAANEHIHRDGKRHRH